MTLRTFLSIAGIVFVVAGYLAMRYFSENVYIKGKYDRGRYVKAGGKK